jgi:hypothetical protein
MRITYLAVPALLFAGVAVAQGEGRSDPRDPKAKVPPVEFRSAFEGYRAHAEQDLRDWRKSNQEVGQTSKPQQGKPESYGGHGGHK